MGRRRGNVAILTYLCTAKRIIVKSIPHNNNDKSRNCKRHRETDRHRQSRSAHSRGAVDDSGEKQSRPWRERISPRLRHIRHQAEGHEDSARHQQEHHAYSARTSDTPLQGRRLLQRRGRQALNNKPAPARRQSRHAEGRLHREPPFSRNIIE